MPFITASSRTGRKAAEHGFSAMSFTGRDVL